MRRPSLASIGRLWHPSTGETTECASDMNENPKSPTEITREKLYELVWSTPMTRAAADFGISGNGLAKICDRLDVPYPPRGYWAKKAAGKPTATLRLPDRKETTPNIVKITPTPTPIKTTHIEAADREIAKAKSDIEIIVLERLTRPHAIIAGWIADRERRRIEAKRDKWSAAYYPGEFTPSDRRQHRILDTLFKALEQRDFKVKQGERSELLAHVEQEKIQFQIREKQKQVRRPLTDDERKNFWTKNKKHIQELQPTGLLAFSIKTYLPAGLRTEWVESNDRTIESLLPEIVATFIAAGPALVEQSKRREAEEARRRE